MDKAKSISLCMIVKNEEESIGRCLESVRGFVDEMIIVDTGSTDRTVEICTTFGAKIFHYEWNDHFAHARNYGLEQASGDWLLWLDADEEMKKADFAQFRDKIFQEQDKSVFSIYLINYYGSYPPSEDVAFNIAHPRIFRNHIGIRYNNAIHEQLNLLEVMKEEEIGFLPLKVYHYGYMDEVVANKDKAKRNIELIKKEIEKDENDSWLNYHLASEYYRIVDLETAFEYVNKSILCFLKKGFTPPSLVYRLKYSIIIQVGSIDGAWPAINKAIEIYPDYVDLHFFKGVILYLKEEYDESIQTLEKCIEIGEFNLSHLTLTGAGSFMAWYYKGACYEKKGNLVEAIQCYLQSRQLSSNYEETNSAIDRLRKDEKDTLNKVLSACTDQGFVESLLEPNK